MVRCCILYWPFAAAALINDPHFLTVFCLIVYSVLRKVRKAYALLFLVSDIHVSYLNNFSLLAKWSFFFSCGFALLENTIRLIRIVFQAGVCPCN